MKTTFASVLLVTLGMMVFTGCRKDPNDYPHQPGAVFFIDNSSGGNHVLAYKRALDGSLSWHQSYATGGKGNDMGLGSQGAVTLYGNYLFVCNPGSNELTVFSLTLSGLQWIDKIGSHGTTPVSVAVHDRMVYVLNAGKTSNIAGFQMMSDGHLKYIENSERTLSTAAAPAQVSFNPGGTQLVVTEKAPNMIKTYAVNPDGTPGTAMSHPSAGVTPFGFAFSKKGYIFVAEAFADQPGKSTLSSYKLSNNGDFSTVSAAVPTYQTAACWVAITRDEKYCYTTNTGSGNVSGYSIAANGTVKLLDNNGVTGVTGGAPADVSMSNDSRYLYVRNGMINTVSIFKINDKGALKLLNTVKGLPPAAAGLAAR